MPRQSASQAVRSSEPTMPIPQHCAEKPPFVDGHYLGSIRVDQISVFTLQKFQAHCVKKGIAESTVNRILATYRRMGRKLVKWKVISSPFPAIELRKEDRKS